MAKATAQRSPRQPPAQPAKRPAQPHDRLFGLVFGDKAHAAPYLQAVLPRHLSRRLDFSRLEAVPTKFLTDALGMTESDVLFTAPMDDGSLVYLLIEQETSKDRYLVVRVLRYALSICVQHRRQHPGTDWPGLAAVVLYNGKSEWGFPVRIRDFITDKSRAATMTRLGLVPVFAIKKLDDLGRLSARRLRRRRLTPAGLVTLVLMKTAPRSTDLDVQLRPWAADVRAVLDADADADGQIFRAMVIYVNLVSKTPEDQLRQLFADIDPRAEMTYMTTADQIRADERAVTLKETILEQLWSRFEDVPADVVATVQNGSLRDLKTWTKNFAKAEHLFGPEPFGPLWPLILGLKTSSMDPSGARPRTPRTDMGRMTTADQLVTEGRSAELAETLLRLLPIRFNRPVPADKVAMVKGGSLRDLRTWTDRVVTADSMDQVFNPKINGHKGPDGSGPKK